MSVNLLELLKGQMGGAVVNQLGNFLGESQPATQKAIDGVLPTLLTGLMSQASTQNGASSLFNLLQTGGHNGNILSNLSGLLGNSDSTNNLVQAGLPIVKNLLGDRFAGITDFIASYSGIRSSSSSSLMGFLAPMVMGLLGKQVASNGLNASGLASLLFSQKNHLAAAAPAGLMGALGLSGGFDGILNTAKSQFGNTVNFGTEGVSNAAKTVGNVAANTAARVEETGSGIGKWLLPLLLLLGAGAGLLYFMKGCGGQVADVANDATAVVTDGAAVVGDAATATVDAAGDAATATVDAAGNAVNAAGDAATATVDAAGDAANAVVAGVADLGKFFKRKLSTGVELNIPEKGVENKLISFIEDKSKAVDKTTWFSFDRLLFDTGKSTLKKESQEQVKNIVEILKAFPTVELKLGGYTDNVGNPESNKKLSDARAKTVMAEIVKAGIDAKRLAAEGYGQENPICPANDTKECQAQNRRIDVRVTKK